MPIRPEMRDRYPKDWKLRSFFVRFIRAKGRCEWCGVPHGAWVHRSGGGFVIWSDPDAARASEVPVTKIVLTTAHVFDSAPESCSLLNLAALCQACHLWHDRDIHKANRQLFRERRMGQTRMFA